MEVGDLGAFKGLYIQTAREHIKTIRDALLVLNDPQKKSQAIIDAHIASHSLKSESFAMGHLTTSQVAHVLENIFAKAKKEGMTFSIAVTEAIGIATDRIEASISHFETEGKEIDLTIDLANLTLATGISEKATV